MARWTVVIWLGLAGVAGAAAAASLDWMQFGFDSRHSGANSAETTIHILNVSTLHPLYHVALPVIAAGAPVYLSNVVTPDGVADLLFLTTQDGRILALDAATGATKWSAQPASGPKFTTSSPAIDPNRLYVYSYGLDGMVHKVQVGDGTEITGGGWPELATLKPEVEKSSPALAIATAASGSTYLYVASGGYPDDSGDYQGHVTAIDLATGKQNFWNALCSDLGMRFVSNGACGPRQAGVWARAGVVYDAELDRILFATGNGTFDASSGGHDWGDTILALRPDGSSDAGMPLDSFTPTNCVQLDTFDQDLGSTAPAILPVPPGSTVAHLAAHVGKDLTVRLLNLDDMSGMGGPGHVGGEIQDLALPQGNEALPQPAVWVDPADGTAWLFVANYAGISGFRLGLDATGKPALTAVWTNNVAGTTPVVANGMVFYAAAGAGLEALDPTTGNVLWVDNSIGNTHWQSPIVVNGRLFMTDETPELWAYGPNPEPLDFYSLPPCRVLDTRNPAGPYGGPALSGDAGKRLFQITGQCGVPADARSIAANVTVVFPSALGYLQVAPAGITVTTSTINFNPGEVRANNAVLGLTGNPYGSLGILTLPGVTVDVILDVTGYFK